MALTKPAKKAAVALGCAGLSVVAPALAPVLAGSGLFAILHDLFKDENSLGRLTLNTIAGVLTNLSADAIGSLPGVLSKEHNYDLERALADAYLDALVFLSSESEHKGGELKRQFDEWLPCWESRINRGLKQRDLTSLFFVDAQAGDTARPARWFAGDD